MKNLRNWFPAFAVMIVIFMLSSTSGTTIQSAGLGNETLHRVGHLLMFALLCIAYYKATKKAGYAILLTVVYSLFDELHQKFVYLRSASLFDVVVDTLGALLAGLVLWTLQSILPKIL